MRLVILAIVTGLLAFVAHGEHHPLPAIVLTVIAIVAVLVRVIMHFLGFDDHAADTLPDRPQARQIDYRQELRLPGHDVERSVRLRHKRDEYRLRMEDSKSPDTSAGTRYKFRILDTLITIGPVNTARLEATLRVEEGMNFDETWYDEACRVIQSYVDSGGAGLHGGQLPA